MEPSLPHESSNYVDVNITEEGDLHTLRNTFGPGDCETMHGLFYEQKNL